MHNMISVLCQKGGNMHKPQLAILASTPDTAQRLYCQYQEIFDGYLDIQYYSFQNVPQKLR